LAFQGGGVGGVEGGPPQFNLAALCGCGSSGSSSTTCEDYGGDPELTGSVRTTLQQGSSFCCGCWMPRDDPLSCDSAIRAPDAGHRHM